MSARAAITTIASVLPAVVALSAAAASSQGCTLSGSLSGGLPCKRVLNASGSAWLDQAFNKEIYVVGGMLGVSPSFQLCDEVGGGNAFASSEVTNPMYPAGSVFFGTTLLREELNTSGWDRNFSVPAILAHEFGHILQFKARVSLPTKLKELQADYLAGWVMGNRDRFSGWAPAAFRNTSESFFAKGDYNFNSPGHHGTPAERAAAITEGFRNADRTLADAFRHSHDYVVNGGGAEDSGDEDGSDAVANDTSWCDAVKAFVDAVNGKRNVKGRRDPVDKSWETTVLPPTGDPCFVDASAPEISCTERYPNASTRDAAVEEITDELTACFDADPKKVQSGSSVAYDYALSDGTTIRVKPTINKDMTPTGYFIHLDVKSGW